MKNSLLLGIGRYLFPIPSPLWQNQVAQSAKQNQGRLAFMTPGHHRVRNLVVRELPHIGAPLAPDWIAQQASLPVETVSAILIDLEKHLPLTDLYRIG